MTQQIRKMNYLCASASLIITVRNSQNLYKMICISISTTIVFPVVEEIHKLEMTFK